MASMTLTCRVQYLDDTDPFTNSTNFPEPARPPTYIFLTNVQLQNQIAGLKRTIRAPHQLEDCALQLYWNNGTQSDFGIYLDLDSTLDEQAEELEGFTDNKKNAIILRTQLSIRVHTCIEKLLNSNGRDLRKALFALKQIFQDDKDLVHAFVTNEGLDCLIKVGSEGDQNQQNYILRALGQVMLYVDGMNGVISHNKTVQWLYSLVQSKFRLVVKNALKLLLLFVEYAEANTMLVIEAIKTVDLHEGMKPWSNIMVVLNDSSGEDAELLVYAMTLVNKMLNAIPDQDLFYDVTDIMEEQGMERIVERYMTNPETEDDLLEQFKIYEAVLSHEDGQGESELITSRENIRKTPRIKSEDDLRRRSRRRSDSGSGNMLTARSLNALNRLPIEEETTDKHRDETGSSDSVSNTSSPREPVTCPVDDEKNKAREDSVQADIRNNNDVLMSKANFIRSRRRMRRLQDSPGKSSSMTNLAECTTSPATSSRLTRDSDMKDQASASSNSEKLCDAIKVCANSISVGQPSNGEAHKPNKSFLQGQKYQFHSPDAENPAVAPSVGSSSRFVDELSGLYQPLSTNRNSDSSDAHGELKKSSSPQVYGDSRNSENKWGKFGRNVDDLYAASMPDRLTTSSPSTRINELQKLPNTSAQCPAEHSMLYAVPLVASGQPPQVDNSAESNSSYFEISRLTLVDGPKHHFEPNQKDFFTDTTLAENLPKESVGDESHPLDDLLSQYRLSHLDDSDVRPEEGGQIADGEQQKSSLGSSSPSDRLTLYYAKSRSPFQEDGTDSLQYRIRELRALSEEATDELMTQIPTGRASLKPRVGGASAPQRLLDAGSDEKPDLRWENMKRDVKGLPLKIKDLDFTNLTDADDINYLGVQTASKIRLPHFTQSARSLPSVSAVPPLPPLPLGIPPPPLPPDIVPQPPPPMPTHDVIKTAQKSKKTMKLHWKEAKVEFFTPSGRTSETVWTKMAREVGHVSINANQLEHLFELKSQDVKGKESVNQKQDGIKKEITILDPKRSNAINIGRTSLPGSTDSIKTAIINMDGSILSREAIEKLLTTMMPTDEEKAKIYEAQSSNTVDIPLGTAEQFLLAMGSISELHSRLKLWLFKLDYETIEAEISEPLSDLMNGIEELRRNRTFKYILATLLSIGNFLNGSEAHGFTIEYLSRVPEVKDTVHKHTLLHHLANYVIDKFPEGSDLYSEIGTIIRCAKADWSVLEEQLKGLETECKASWNHLSSIIKHEISASLKNKLSEFLSDCSKRIILLQTVHGRVMNRYNKFLLYLGYSPEVINDVKVQLFCKTISEFALEYRTTREKVLQMIEKKAKQRERKKTRGKMIVETDSFALKTKPAAVVEEEPDELNKLLQNGTGTALFKSRRRASREPNAKSSSSASTKDAKKKALAPDAYDTPEDDLLDSVLRTATTTPAEQKPRERRRARNNDRKSLRRTLKNGLTSEELAVVFEKKP